MIVEVTKPKSSFLDFMLYQEKDDAPRRNMKVINLKVSDKRRQDFTKGAEIEDEEELPEEETTGEETETPTDEPVTDDEDYTDGGEVATGDEPVTDDTDYTGGDEPETETEQPSEETSQEPAPEDTTTTDEPATEEPVADTGGGEDAGEAPAEGDTGDGPIIDDEDYTAGGDAEVDAGGDDGGEAPAEGDAGDTPGDTPEGNGEEQTDSPVEQLYKYNLYKKFQKVLKSIDEYSIELDNIVSDDFEVNAKYKELTAKLKEIESLMEDYMIMKFSKVSFMQSMLFYQRVVTSVDIILQTLKYVREKDLKSKM